MIFPGLGTICIFGEDAGMYAGTGIRYQSPDFKSIYLGYPLETMDPNDATRLMEMALSWYYEPIPDNVNVLVFDSDYDEDKLYGYYDMTFDGLNATV